MHRAQAVVYPAWVALGNGGDAPLLLGGGHLNAHINVVAEVFALGVLRPPIGLVCSRHRWGGHLHRHIGRLANGRGGERHTVGGSQARPACKDELVARSPRPRARVADAPRLGKPLAPLHDGIIGDIHIGHKNSLIHPHGCGWDGVDAGVENVAEGAAVGVVEPPIGVDSARLLRGAEG